MREAGREAREGGKERGREGRKGGSQRVSNNRATNFENQLRGSNLKQELKKIVEGRSPKNDLNEMPQLVMGFRATPHPF